MAEGKHESLKYTPSSEQAVLRSKSDEVLGLIKKWADIGYWEWNLELNRFEFDEKALNILGLEETDLSHDDFFGLIHANDQPVFLKAEKSLFKKEALLDVQLRLMQSNGFDHWIQIRGERLSNENGQKTFVRGIIRTLDNTYEHFFIRLHEIIHSCPKLTHTLSGVLSEIKTVAQVLSGEFWLVSRDHLDIRKQILDKESVVGTSGGNEELDQAIKKLVFEVWEKSSFISHHIQIKNAAGEEKDSDSFLSGVPIELDGRILGVLVLSTENDLSRDEDILSLLNKILAYLAIDIHRKQAVQQNEAFIKHSPDILACVSQSGKIVRINPACSKLFGYSQEDVLGRMFTDFLHPEDVENTISQFLAQQAGDYSGTVENRFISKDGEWHWVEWYPSEWDDSDGIMYLYGHDVTEQKRTSDDLARFKNVIQNFPDAIAILNLQKGCTYVNDSMIEMSGYSVEEFQKLESLFSLYSDSNLKDIVPRMLLEGNYWQGDVVLNTKDGKSIEIYLSAGPVFNSDNELIAIYTVHTDIREQRLAQKKIRESLREKEILLSEIHHRVKNNLAVVSSMLQLQAMQVQNEELNSKLLESSLRIKTIASIHEHLYESDNFSRIDFSRNIRSLVQSVVNTLKSDSEISITLDCNSVMLNVNQAIPCSLIVNEVVTNIINHAFEGRSKGTIHVALHEKDDYIHLSISDNGNGRSEKYYQESDYGKSLGLHIIHLLSKQLDAELEIQSSNGSIFTLCFLKAEAKGIGNADLI
ncbi:PAS domain S-box protein [Balneolaceae bacterium ANBcel3]|nr:PAS domain S-box protein [Balneolaceae bacterium ANBcel3]